MMNSLQFMRKHKLHLTHLMTLKEQMTLIFPQQ
jgi:hypothetical protein